MPTPRHEIVRRIREGRTFLVAAHASPDGDALGSTAAMGFVLEALGKTFTLLNDSPVPPQYGWMELPGPLLAAPASDDYDLAIVLDCGDAPRLGRLRDILDPARMAVIDHHLGNPGFGAVNWVSPGHCATGEMVALLAKDLGVPLTGPLAEALYTAMATDTGFFSFSGTTATCMELGAELIRGGLDVGATGARIKNQWTVGRVRLWSEALGELSLRDHGQVGLIRVSQEMLKRAGAGPEDCEGLINNALRIKGVDAAILVRELPAGGLKFSLRSVGAVDIQAVAAAFGGGGHKNAAGGTLSLPLAEAEDVLAAAVAQAVEAVRGA
ncbi:phosphoesterase RecJ domain protein [Solidesulfovibrio carbinoliphilus subsp. oakridgensis]|uniref:Phosphoesterase RecJ domain protein n=1 Tax=Solidesulfovibrio carbinoliphilus subsp. oakridgensis TaxID=694327 RepID=G7QCN0_9BACT|nr:DHH family phosphoesterase [Solidesulfovibrio carbinoliphilus]EHJ46186.1 phosphoesterase RecJ domain protein [Solidesulfovibrio carbinoliphilus subsp. oakridgensis]